MKIGYVLFERFHQRRNIGSSRIRGHWMIEELNKIKGVEAECFIQGKDYDVVVYQKAYWKEHAKEFKGLKILDICDPDWLDGAEIVSFLQHINIVITSSNKLRDEIGKFTDKPVYFIDDGIKDIEERKKHKGRAKTLCWFGYSGNFSLIEPALLKVKKLGLTLRLISDGNFTSSICKIENIKWDAETVNEMIKECDMCLLPDGMSGRFMYKSQNKTYQSWALGIPVIKTPDQMEKWMDGEEREKESKRCYKEVKNNLVKYRAKELLDIIKLQDSFKIITSDGLYDRVILERPGVKF